MTEAVQTTAAEIIAEWQRDPDALAEDELIPPTSEACVKAIELVKLQRTPFGRCVPDGDGGIVLERWVGSVISSVEIDSAGAIEFVECVDGKVTKRVQCG